MDRQVQQITRISPVAAGSLSAVQQYAEGLLAAGLPPPARVAEQGGAVVALQFAHAAPPAGRSRNRRNACSAFACSRAASAANVSAPAGVIS